MNPVHLDDLVQATQCADCDSDVTIVELGRPGIYSAEVRHDDTCPFYVALQRDGG